MYCLTDPGLLASRNTHLEWSFQYRGKCVYELQSWKHGSQAYLTARLYNDSILQPTKIQIGDKQEICQDLFLGTSKVASFDPSQIWWYQEIKGYEIRPTLRTFFYGQWK